MAILFSTDLYYSNSHLSYGLSAHLLDGLLSLLSVLVFIRIVEVLGGCQRILWLAALVILFDHQFNVLRDNIIRDHGFWAFYLLSVYCLLLWYRQPKWTTALLWNVSLVMATLFRIEGAIFLLAMPFVAFCQMRQPLLARLNYFFMLNLLLILVLAVFGISQLFHPDQTIHHLGRINEVLHQLQNGTAISSMFYATGCTDCKYLGNHLDASAIVILYGWQYLYNVLLTLGWAYAVLFLFRENTKAKNFILLSGDISSLMFFSPLDSWREPFISSVILWADSFAHVGAICHQ